MSTKRISCRTFLLLTVTLTAVVAAELVLEGNAYVTGPRVAFARGGGGGGAGGGGGGGSGSDGGGDHGGHTGAHSGATQGGRASGGDGDRQSAGPGPSAGTPEELGKLEREREQERLGEQDPQADQDRERDRDQLRERGVMHEQAPGQAPGQQPVRSPIDMHTSMRVQHALNAMGHAAGPEDGIIGPRTRAAVMSYQSQQGMTPDGKLSADLARQILEHAEHGGRAD